MVAFAKTFIWIKVIPRTFCDPETWNEKQSLSAYSRMLQGVTALHLQVYKTKQNEKEVITSF